MIEGLGISPPLNKVEIRNDGLYINNTHISSLVSVDIRSPVENISEITIKFLGKIKGLDDLLDNQKHT